MSHIQVEHMGQYYIFLEETPMPTTPAPPGKKWNRTAAGNWDLVIDIGTKKKDLELCFDFVKRRMVEAPGSKPLQLSNRHYALLRPDGMVEDNIFSPNRPIPKNQYLAWIETQDASFVGLSQRPVEDYLVNDVKGNTKGIIEFFKEGRTYIKNPSDAPEGASLRRGPKGGIYYEEPAGKKAEKPSSEPAKSSDSKPAESKALPKGKSPIATHIEKTMDMMENPKQKRYYGLQLNELKSVKTQPLTDEENSIVKKYTYEKPQARECYANAQRLAHNSDGEIKYVEGFYLFDDFPFPIDHAWNEINGKFFDPTLLGRGKDSSKVHYYGKVIPMKQVVDNMLSTEQYTSVLRQEFREKMEKHKDDYFYDESKIKKVIKKVQSEITKDDKAKIKQAMFKFENNKDTRAVHSDGKGNYAPERKKLHDEIISNMLKGAIRSKKPTAYFLAGSPGSGKSTALSGVLGKQEDFVYLNNDDIKAQLPEFKKNPIFSSEVHEEASDIESIIMKKILENKYNFILDATFRSADKSIRRVQHSKGEGYKVHMIATECPTHISIERAHKRFIRSKRYVPYGYIHKSAKLINESVNLMKSEVDSYKIYDTDVEKGKPAKRVEKMKESIEKENEATEFDDKVSKIYSELENYREKKLDEVLLEKGI